MFMLCNISKGGSNWTDVSGAGLDPGFAAQVLGAAGNYQGDFLAVIRQMAKVGVNVLDISRLEAPALDTGAIIYRQMEEGAVPGSTYISLTSGEDLCFFVPQSITWSAGGVASMNVMMHFLSSNGTTAPLTVGSSAGATTAVSTVWAGNLECVESMTVNFGYGIRFCNDGLLYPQHVYITSQRPSISLVTNEQSEIVTADMNPGEIGTLTAQFAQVAEGGVRGTPRSYAVTGHISKTLTGDRPGQVRVSVQGKGGITIS